MNHSGLPSDRLGMEDSTACFTCQLRLPCWIAQVASDSGGGGGAGEEAGEPPPPPARRCSYYDANLLQDTRLPTPDAAGGEA